MQSDLHPRDSIPLRAIAAKGPLRTTAKFGKVQLSKMTARRLFNRGWVKIDENGFVSLTRAGQRAISPDHGAKP